MPLQLDDSDGFEVASLVYRKWAEAHDSRKAVKAEKPDYKTEPDWDQMHVIRLENAEKEFAKWAAMLKRITQQIPKLV